MAVAIAAGLVATTAAAAPTSSHLWDASLKAILSVVVVVAVARGPRWSAIVFAAVAAASIGLNSWVIPAWGGLLLAVLPIALPRRNRVLAALSAALASQVLLRLPAFGFFGLPSLIAGGLVCLRWDSATKMQRD